MTCGLTTEHVSWLYDHYCKSCRHVKKGRKECPILCELRQDPASPRLDGKVRARNSWEAHCPYWDAKVPAK